MEHQVSAEDVARMLNEALPVGSPYFEVTAVGAREEKENLLAVLRTITWDVDEATGERSIRDIKEQEGLFVSSACRDSQERVAAYVRAWASALGEVLTQLGRARALHESMPLDFVHHQALKLARAESEEDFRKALLAKSRLGGLLAGP